MLDTSRFLDKVVFVTGGAKGLGEAICRKFASEKATVIVSDIDEEGALVCSQKLVSDFGIKSLGIRMDVTDDFEVHSIMEMVESDFGRLDVLVANAGVLKSSEITEFPVSEWRLVMEVNLVGYFICAKHACQIMKKQKFGNIIQINAESGKRGSARNSAYAASKFGGVGLTQSIALEMAPYKVRANAICPGNILEGSLWQGSLLQQFSEQFELTIDQVKAKYIDQVPLGRSCNYDDVTNLVTFLASDEASYMTGQSINVTGGQEMG